MSKANLSTQGIIDLASAYYGSAVLFAAVEHDIFTRVEKGEAGLAEQRGMRLLLDACVAIGLLGKSPDGAYSNTSAGRASLVAGSPADLTKAILYNRDVYPLWGKLPQFAATGKPVEKPGIHLGEDPSRTRRFALSMRSRAFAIGRSVVPLIDLAGCTRLLDLAGGPGTYAELLARANPGVNFVTVDLPAISSIAAECVAEAGMAGRVECVAGDYHTITFPPGSFDAVTIFGALHQESPEQITCILKNAATALKPGGRVFVLDMMTDSTHTAPAFSALFAVNMALTTDNGWVFSDDELKGWLREAGFTPGPTTPLPPPMPHWLATGTKI